MGKRILVGKIVSAHGIKGEVKVVCHADDPLLLFGDDGVYTSETGGIRIQVDPRAEPKPNLFIASIEGVNDRNAAEALRGTPLYIDRDDLPALEGHEGIYHTDLEGLDAVTPEGKALGKIARVQNFGAGDLLDIEGIKGSFFIPFCAPYLVSIDLEERRVVLNEPEVM